MTTKQKQAIVSLRDGGFGYMTIANALGISKENVKSYCRYHGLTGKKADNNSRISLEHSFCPHCGKLLTQSLGRKKRKFCCDDCRSAWWNTHQDKVNKQAVYNFTCASCGKPFTAYGNASRKYCCHECYIKARYKGGGGDE
ncbi:MAG: RNA polymerase subunit sigma-70 [Oscillospiraceae bacterium]